MDGLLTILPHPIYQTIEEIFSELNTRFQLYENTITFNPHFSYHVAESYADEQVQPLMQRVAQETAVFTIKANGIGIFPAPEPILYIPIARTKQLNAIHETIWKTFNPIAQASVAYYHPDNWFPHITIGTSGLPTNKLGTAIQWLLQQNLYFETEATNLTFFREVAVGYEQAFQFQFSK